MQLASVMAKRQVQSAEVAQCIQIQTVCLYLISTAGEQLDLKGKLNGLT